MGGRRGTDGKEIGYTGRKSGLLEPSLSVQNTNDSKNIDSL